MCVCVTICWVRVDAQGGQTLLDPWSWSYRCLGTTRSECWEPNWGIKTSHRQKKTPQLKAGETEQLGSQQDRRLRTASVVVVWVYPLVPKQKSICVFVSLVTSESGFSYVLFPGVPFPLGSCSSCCVWQMLKLRSHSCLRRFRRNSGFRGIDFSNFFWDSVFYTPASSDSIYGQGWTWTWDSPACFSCALRWWLCPTAAWGLKQGLSACCATLFAPGHTSSPFVRFICLSGVLSPSDSLTLLPISPDLMLLVLLPQKCQGHGVPPCLVDYELLIMY